MALQGCPSEDPVRLGFVGPLTGRFSELGVHGRNGAILALETVNANGGVNGRRVDLVVENDQGTVNGALDAVRRLIAQDIHVFLGPMTSTQAAAVLPAVEEAGGVCVSPTASSQTLDGKKDALYRLAPSDRFQAEVLAKRMVSDRRIKTLLILWDEDNEAFSKVYAESVAQAFSRQGGIVVGQYAFRSSSQGFWNRLTVPIGHIGPDGLLVVASAKDTASWCQSLARQGVRVAVFASFWARSPDLLLYGGRTVEGVEVVGPMDFGAVSPMMQNFVEAYRRRFGKDPNHAAVFAYEAVLLIQHALAQSLASHRPLRDTLIADYNIVGPTGPLKLTDCGDRILPCVVETVSGGRFVAE